MMSTRYISALLSPDHPLTYWELGCGAPRAVSSLSSSGSAMASRASLIKRPAKAAKADIANAGGLPEEPVHLAFLPRILAACR